jgi:hypothetical protein
VEHSVAQFAGSSAMEGRDLRVAFLPVPGVAAVRRPVSGPSRPSCRGRHLGDLGILRVGAELWLVGGRVPLGHSMTELAVSAGVVLALSLALVLRVSPGWTAPEGPYKRKLRARAADVRSVATISLTEPVMWAMQRAWSTWNVRQLTRAMAGGRR